MSVYRNDLDAALARNADLQRRVGELERALAQTTASHARATPSRSVYVAPATYLPFVNLAETYLAFAMRQWRARPRLDLETLPQSNIVVLEPLRLLFVVVLVPLSLVLQASWFVIRTGYLTVSSLLAAGCAVPLSALAAPVIAALSFRRRTGTATPAGVRWNGRDEVEATLYGILCWMIPLFALLILWIGVA